MFARQERAHFTQELPRGVRARFQRIGDCLNGFITLTKLVLVDQRVRKCGRCAADAGCRLPCRTSGALPRCNAGIPTLRRNLDRTMFAPVLTMASIIRLRIISTNTAFETGANQRAREAQNHAAILVAQHPVVDDGGAVQIARAERHMLHVFHKTHHIVPRDVNMLKSRLSADLLSHSSKKPFNVTFRNFQKDCPIVC